MAGGLDNRLKRLENKKTNLSSLPIFIELLEGGMVEVCSNIDGNKEILNEKEYQIWNEQFLKFSNRPLIEISFVDDISSNSE